MNRKILNATSLPLFVIILAMTVLACTCGGFTRILTPDATPSSSFNEPPTSTPNLFQPPNPTLPQPLVVPGGGDGTGGGGADPMHGLPGAWESRSGEVVTIEWTGNAYHVVSHVDEQGGPYQITSEDWDGSTFTWKYKLSSGVTITIQALSVSGDTLFVKVIGANFVAEDTFTRIR